MNRNVMARCLLAVLGAIVAWSAVVALSGCAASRTITVERDGVMVAQVREDAWWQLTGEWTTTVDVRGDDVTTTDTRTKGSWGNLFSMVGGAAAGWFAKGK